LNSNASIVHNDGVKTISEILQSSEGFNKRITKHFHGIPLMGTMCPTLNHKLSLQVEGIHQSEIQNNKITVNVSPKSIDTKSMNLSNLQQKGCPSSRIKGRSSYRVLWTCKL
jgi:hypothetical protein